MIQPAAIVRPAEDFELCACPECQRLDRKYPGQGWQLALLRYRISLRKERRGR